MPSSLVVRIRRAGSLARPIPSRPKLAPGRLGRSMFYDAQPGCQSALNFDPGSASNIDPVFSH
jgi:hypothetical protein